jgi:hypothetical protein
MRTERRHPGRQERLKNAQNSDSFSIFMLIEALDAALQRRAPPGMTAVPSGKFLIKYLH